MSIYYIEDKNGTYLSPDKKKRFIKLTGKSAYDFLMLAPGRNDQIGLSKNRQKRFRRKRQTTMCIIEIKQSI